MVEAAELFNESAYRRTIAGIAKSLGERARQPPPALRRQPRGRDHGRVGHLLVPVPRLARLAAARPARRARLRARRPRPPLHALERPPRRRRPGHAGHPAPVVRRDRMPIETGTMIYCVIPPELEDGAVREARRALQGQPERRGHRRPAHRPRPAPQRQRPAGGRAADDPRPPPRPPGDVPADRPARSGVAASGVRGPEPQHRDDPERRARGRGTRTPSASRPRRRRRACSQIVATVSVKPTASCIVSAVPT